MMFVVFFGAQGSRAWAQTEPHLAQALPALIPALQPVFVSQEVVQPLPQAPAVTADSLAGLVDTTVVEGELAGDMLCLAQAVYFEARGEPLEGQLAVANVVINRAKSDLYPGDICSVVKQPAQFSFVRKGAIPAVNESSAAWRRAKAIAQIAHDDLWDCQADDALFFHATYVRPSWARRKTRLAQIDTHIFYR